MPLRSGYGPSRARPRPLPPRLGNDAPPSASGRRSADATEPPTRPSPRRSPPSPPQGGPVLGARAPPRAPKRGLRAGTAPAQQPAPVHAGREGAGEERVAAGRAWDGGGGAGRTPTADEASAVRPDDDAPPALGTGLYSMWGGEAVGELQPVRLVSAQGQEHSGLVHNPALWSDKWPSKRGSGLAYL
eukprot:scaffold1183_cov418-Prasinococcus_capsulatus_cf.AAC.28